MNACRYTTALQLMDQCLVENLSAEELGARISAMLKHVRENFEHPTKNSKPADFPDLAKIMSKWDDNIPYDMIRQVPSTLCDQVYLIALFKTVLLTQTTKVDHRTFDDGEFDWFHRTYSPLVIKTIPGVQ